MPKCGHSRRLAVAAADTRSHCVCGSLLKFCGLMRTQKYSNLHTSTSTIAPANCKAEAKITVLPKPERGEITSWPDRPLYIRPDDTTAAVFSCQSKGSGRTHLVEFVIRYEVRDINNFILLFAVGIFTIANSLHWGKIIIARSTHEYVRSAVFLWYVVCPSVCPSVTLMYCDHIYWDSLKVMSRIDWVILPLL